MLDIRDHTLKDVGAKKWKLVSVCKVALTHTCANTGHSRGFGKLSGNQATVVGFILIGLPSRASRMREKNVSSRNSSRREKETTTRSLS